MSHKCYQPVWEMVYKLRVTMGKRDDLYTLEDMVEFDERHFEVDSEGLKVPLKRGKGSQRQKHVAESTPVGRSSDWEDQ